MRRSVTSPSRRGFTLIEVMVSTAIMIVIVLAVVTVASDTFKAYDKAVADLTSQSEARGVLDSFENDFQTAVIRPDGRCWMEVVIPGGSKAPSPLNSASVVVGNVNAIDQPVIMLFSSPADRPRWSPVSSSSRTPIKGDVCAVAYRLGQSSPFDSPGDPIQRVYGVYRTIIDPENTFKEAIPEILYENASATTLVLTTPTSTTYKSPISYWGTGKRTMINYTTSNAKDSQNLITSVVSTSGTSFTPCWTLDQSNFIGANVVSMNFIFWCSSTLSPKPTTSVTGAFYDPLARSADVLRPVIAESTTTDAVRFSTGYAGAYSYSPSVSNSMSRSNAAELRWAAAGSNVPASATKTPHPVDAFGSRLLVCADRMYTDQNAAPSVPTATALKYLPYRLRAVEVSITILTPEGSKELRALQNITGQKSVKGVTIGTEDFKRIVSQYGKTFTRYIRLLGNGG